MGIYNPPAASGEEFDSTGYVYLPDPLDEWQDFVQYGRSNVITYNGGVYLVYADMPTSSAGIDPDGTPDTLTDYFQRLGGGGAGGGSTYYLASVAGEQSHSVAGVAFADRPKAAEIEFTVAGPAIVEYALGLEDWHDGNGVVVNPTLDDVALRQGDAFNTSEMSEWVFGLSANTWIHHVLDRPWTDYGVSNPGKARELLFARTIIVAAGDHAADVRFAINSTGTAKVRNVNLALRVTEVTAV